MKDLLIYPNLGLGDEIICNGLVRHFAKAEPNRWIQVMCKAHNAASVEWMYGDVPNVSVTVVGDDLKADQAAREIVDAGIAELLRLHGGGNTFDQQFYQAAGVPFEQRWDGFQVERASKQHYVPPGPFCFIHDDPVRGFKIADPKGPNIIRATYDPGTPNIFQWQAILEMAESIHCIPSCFSVLVDSLPDVPEQKLFLHTSARPNGELPTYRKPWTHV